MSLRKRGSVFWTYFWSGGVRHQESTGTGNRRQAQEVELKLKAEAHARRYELVREDPSLTFANLAARFAATGRPKLYHLERLKQLLPYFGDIPLVKITKNLAREYRHLRKSRDAVTDATINRDLSVLRHLLYWAVDEGLLTSNPLAHLRMGRERRVARPVMSVEEEDQLLAVAPEHLAAIVVAALDTGMRRGEILSQDWEHLDFTRGILSVTRSKTPEGEAREIPLTRRLLNVIESQPAREGSVFVYHENAIADIKTAWKHALEKAQIRHFRFHDLRHTFNTRLLEAGVMQEVRKALMGHVSGEKTHSTYTHVELPAKRNAIARLEKWVEHQRQLLGGNNASQEAFRTTTTEPGDSARNVGRAKGLEEEDAGRDIPRPGRKAASRGRAGRART